MLVFSFLLDLNYRSFLYDLFILLFTQSFRLFCSLRDLSINVIVYFCLCFWTAVWIENLPWLTAFCINSFFQQKSINSTEILGTSVLFLIDVVVLLPWILFLTDYNAISSVSKVISDWEDILWKSFYLSASGNYFRFNTSATTVTKASLRTAT